MSNATLASKSQLTSQQRAWLKTIAAAWKIPQTAGTPAKPSSGKRTVPGSGGYVYEQHANGEIFIVQSPRRGKTYIEVKERKPYDAILAEIGPFPASSAVTRSAKPNAGNGAASGILNNVLDALQDAPGQGGKVVKGVADVIREELDKVARQQSVTSTSTPQASASSTPTSGRDSYRSQTDNPELAGGTCNVTTMAMQLLTLADGDEDALRTEAVQLLKDRSVRATTDTQLEELLRQLTIAVAGGKQVELKNKKGEATYHNAWEVAWVLDKTSELFTGVSKTETVYPETSQKGYQDKIVPAVEKHAAVMLANYLTSAGHIVKLHAVLSDGVVIDDPNGCVLESQGAYLRNGGAVNSVVAKRINDHSKLLDERLKENPKLRQELIELATAGKGKLPPNTGKQNFYTWAEVGTYKIGKWANITYKK